jgi:hypothetical protein
VLRVCARVWCWDPRELGRCRVLVAILFALTGAPGLGQSTSDGAIGGRLVVGGMRPAGVRVVAHEVETGLERETLSSATGDFLLAHLAPGEYRVDIAGLGIPARHVANVVVHVASVTELVDGVQPLILLEAEGQPANSDSDAEGEGLPSYRGLATTDNVLSMDGGGQTGSYGLVPVGAGSTVSGDAVAEGDDGESDVGATSRAITSRSVRNAGAPYTFARGAVREFHLTGDTYSALYGSAPGGITAGASNAGTAHLHGAGFLLVRSSALAATDPYAIATTYNNGAIASAAEKPQDLREQFGGSAGGPLLRDRLFLFAAIDAQRRDFPALSSPADPNFYALTPTQTALLANRGVTSGAVNAALNYLDSLTGETPRRADGAVEFGRVDYRRGQRFAGSVEYNRARWDQPAGAVSAPVVSRARASLGNSLEKVDTAFGRGVVFLARGLSDEVRVQYGRELKYETPQAPLPQEPAIAPNGLAPEVAIAPYGLTFGTPAGVGRQDYPDERRVELADLLSWVHGRQHLQLGPEFSAIDTYVASLSNAEGTYSYDSVATGGHAGGLVDWITDYTFNVNAYPNGGCPSIRAVVHLFCFRSFTQSFGQQTVQFNMQQWAGYVQDDVRLAARLMLHVGARYDYQLLPLPQRPNPAIDALFSSQGATSVFPEDRNNVAPRLALAWQPLGPRQGTIRVGYGVYYGRVAGATIRSALLNTDLPASTTHVRIVPSTTTACPQVANQGFGYPCDYTASPAAAIPNATSAMLFSKRFRLPLVQQGSFALERSLGAGMTLTATYRLNLDRQLPTSVDLNIAPSTATMLYEMQGGTGKAGVLDGETFSLPLYTARLSSIVGPVTAISSSANATYHGGTLEVRRVGTRLSFNSGLTWSKALDFGGNQGAVPVTNTQLDPFDNRYDKGISALNFPMRFSLNGVWTPVVHSRERVVRVAANGWSLTPILLVRSGAPYSLMLSGGTYLPGGRESLNGSGGALYLPTVGRNTLRLPPAENLDLRIGRAVRLREGLRLEMQAEAYNLANHVNISSVTERAYLVGAVVAGDPTYTPLVFQNATNIQAEGLNTQPFGTFTDSGTSLARAREIQFGLRVQF